jgi:hypothetical protein
MLDKTIPLRLTGALLTTCVAMPAEEIDNQVVQVSLTLQSATIIEGVGFCLGSLNIKDMNGNPASIPDTLVMDLTSTLPNRLNVTSQVTILAGTSSALITVTGISNGILEGQQAAEIHASSTMATANASVTVVDLGGPG